MSNVRARALIVTLFAASVAVAQPGPDLTIGLRFVPQENTAARIAEPAPPLRDKTVVVAVTDGRAVTDRIGEGTTSDDRPYAVTTAASVPDHVRTVAADLARRWGVRVGQEGDVTLQAEVIRFWVREQNQAVGATYVGEVRLSGSLLDASGVTVWRGEVGGEARRYGRARSGDNVNEVLSDALKDACASLFEMPGWRAWAARHEVMPPQPRIESRIESKTVDPDALLADLVRLQEQGLETSVLVGYVRARRLSRPLEVDDLTAWRAAGIPQEAIAAAVEGSSRDR